MSGPTSSFVQVTENTLHHGTPQRSTKIVAGYALQEKLGSGSFAIVYKGVRTSPSPQQNNNTVAIKAIARTSEKLTKKVLQNLEIEITILRTYRHKNIVCLHDVQKTDRHFYLILEYCGGGDVQGLIRSRKSGRLTEGLTRRLMRDLSSGLKFLWNQQLIHRDIKPQNLLLTGALPLDEVDDPDKTEEIYQRRRAVNFPSGQFSLKIADFGFARHLQTTSLAETLCGSPLYMAPEILQHHRYDAKADLWSVGTVLFEMISGKPPFHGENHIDLLRNIQRKAVRLPADVKVSRECVNLLRLLLNRNPLSRAGFKEFFDASDALVALGCRGPAPIEENTSETTQRPELGTIQERPPSAESMLTVATNPSQPTPQQQALQSYPPQSMPRAPTVPDLSNRPPAAAPPLPSPSAPPRMMMNKPSLVPLVPSPPASGVATNPPPPVPGLSLDGSPNQIRPSRPQTSNSIPQNTTMELTRRGDGGNLQRSNNSDNSFVMVGHGSSQLSPTTVPPPNTIPNQNPQPQQHQAPPLSSPPASPFQITSQVISTRSDYMVVKPPKGMLSTSPGTGGALMGMLTGRTRLLYDNTVPGMKWDTHIGNVTKMLAASEDVGRRAISVAHLGDNRAYMAMKMLMMNESGSSLLLSGGAMEGIEEENDSGAVTDDSSSTEIMASVRRRRSSSMNDTSMADINKDNEEGESEMPFAVAADAQSPPILSAGMPTRVSTSFGKSTSITSSARQSIRPTPMLIRSHFNEALSCYLKALKMLKGAVHGAQGVERELQTLSARVSSDKVASVQKLMKRCQLTIVWLGEQYKGVLERAEASNTEIGKVPNAVGEGERGETPRTCSVDELIFNNALAYGREGAVKQLLGQLEASRSSYRSAGLLAETLLMESNLVGNDRKILEDYVDGFAARITELDELIIQRSKLVGSGGASNLVSSRRASGVVGLVGQPFGTHKLSW
mmetsp:Transcript_1171/g.2527  ORF Transcript_1171/g.2527 Transcript_1171/m.2527 type:complete len:954 (+) Transcript_1171:237-3098(+)